MIFRHITIFLLTIFSFSTYSVAADPTLQHLYPIAGKQGTTITVTPAGKFEPWPPQVWVDGPGVTFKASKDPKKLDVEIAGDASLGPHLIRYYNAQSVTAPDFFIVSSEVDLIEKEPNNDFKLPQEITTLPVTISGRLDPSADVDSYAVTLKRGETINASVEAFVLASPFDGLLRIVRPDGIQLAFNHDGRTLDPELVWTAPQDGKYIIQLMGFPHPATSAPGLTGSAECVYRLRLIGGSVSNINFPKLDATHGVELAEQESDDSKAKVQSIPIPSVVLGSIQKPLDEDRFAFTATKGKSYELQVIAEKAGSPLEAWLKIESEDGKEVARNKNVGSRDPRLIWIAPKDGVYIAALGDIPHHGGKDFVYRLCIREDLPSVTATALAHFVSVAPGKTSEIKVNVKRNNGFSTKLKLAAQELPMGVSAPEVEVSDKAGEMVLKLTAEDGAMPASQPFNLVLRETDGGVEHVVSYPMTSSDQDNGVQKGFSNLVIDSTTQLWLIVPPSAPKPEEPKKEATPEEVKK